MRRHMRLALVVLLAACATDPVSTEPSSQNLLDEGGGKADDTTVLWAGLTSITIERNADDPCNNGYSALGTEPRIYDDWARQRAAVRNVCFEVWSPGITDWDNPDFWQQLDVQVHYRYGTTGAFEQAYVDSNGRRGNNRRYAFPLTYGLDPLTNVPSLAQMRAPFRILSEQNGYALVEADLQVYFTVNGRKLTPAPEALYTIRYQGQVRVPTLAPNPAGYVLHDIVTCESGAVRFGSGAGFFAADMNHAKAAPLAVGLDGSLIYGVGVAKTGGMVQLTYAQQNTVPGQALPGFSDGSGLRITPSGSTMTVAIDAYNRATGAKQVVTATFAGCVAGASN
jgi:hypothetical protein